MTDIHPSYYEQAAVYIDNVPVQPIQLLELYPFAFATALKYLTRERYHGTLLNSNGVADATRMADAQNEIERAIALIADGGLDA